MLTEQRLRQMDQPAERAVCLPGSAYWDPAFLRHEVEHVFNRHWISIGFGYQVALPGQMVPVNVAGQPLLIVRGTDGVIRVFHNVCRHRGAQLVSAEVIEPARAITCPYHGWTFGLDGQCLSAPCWHRNERLPLRPSAADDYGLIEIRTRVWQDTIFIDLSGAAPAFDEIIAPLASRWGTATMAPLSHLTTWEGTIPANWKLVIENFLDTYHSAYVHRQLGPIGVHVAHERTRLSRDIIGQRCLDAAVNKARSGPIPVIPQLEQALGVDDETYCLFPNTLIFAQRSFFSMRAIIPCNAAATRELNVVYVAAETAGDQYRPDHERMAASTRLVNEQDVDILAKLQATRMSPAADRCRFAPDWDFMSHEFQVRLGEALVS